MAADGTALLAATTSPVTRGLPTTRVGQHVAPGEAVAGPAMLGRADRRPAATAGRPRSRRRSYLTAGVLALVGLAVLAMLGSSGRVSVPSVVGLPEDEARRRLEAEELTSTVAARVSSLAVPAGHIISSDPVEGAVVDAGHLVAVIVSTGPPLPPAVVPRAPPSRRGADGEDDEGGGRNDDAARAEGLKEKIERAEDAAEEAEDAADEAKDEAENAVEDEADEDRKSRDRGRR